ncbi:hypothetical protein [Rhodococcus koreensis]
MNRPLTGRDGDDPCRVEPGIEGRPVDGRPVAVEEQRVVTKPARTSAAAAFGLAFGVAAFVCVLIVILSPVGLVLGSGSSDPLGNRLLAPYPGTYAPKRPESSAPRTSTAPT